MPLVGSGAGHINAMPEKLEASIAIRATPLVSDGLSCEEGEERGIEGFGSVEHGHVRGPLEDEQPGVGDLLPQQIADRRRDQGIPLAPD